MDHERYIQAAQTPVPSERRAVSARPVFPHCPVFSGMCGKVLFVRQLFRQGAGVYPAFFRSGRNGPEHSVRPLGPTDQPHPVGCADEPCYPLVHGPDGVLHHIQNLPYPLFDRRRRQGACLLAGDCGRHRRGLCSPAAAGNPTGAAVCAGRGVYPGQPRQRPSAGRSCAACRRVSASGRSGGHRLCFGGPFAKDPV